MDQGEPSSNPGRYNFLFWGKIFSFPCINFYICFIRHLDINRQEHSRRGPVRLGLSTRQRVPNAGLFVPGFTEPGYMIKTKEHRIY
jgi:hypothetical protein